MMTDKTLSAKIEEIIKPKIRTYRAIGSIEGHIKTIGRDGFGRPIVTITTRLDNQDVRCVSSESGLDKIAHLEVGKVIKGLRVKLHGIIFYKYPMILDRIEVERTELFPDKNSLPTIKDLIDLDFTGGKSSVEFIRQGRDDSTDDIDITEILPDYLRANQNNNLRVSVNLSEDEQTYFAKLDVLGIEQAAYTRFDLVDALKAELDFLWKHVALEDNANLAPKALSLKAELKRLFG